MTEALAGLSGGQLPGRSKVEDGREGEEEVEEGEQQNMENEVVNKIFLVVPGETDAAGNGVAHKAVFAAQSAKNGRGFASQVEEECQEGDVMDWLEDDEMMKSWEEVSKVEVKIMVRKKLKARDYKLKVCRTYRWCLMLQR